VQYQNAATLTRYLVIYVQFINNDLLVLHPNIKCQSSNVKSNPKPKCQKKFEFWILVIDLSFGFFHLDFSNIVS